MWPTALHNHSPSQHLLADRFAGLFLSPAALYTAPNMATACSSISRAQFSAMRCLAIDSVTVSVVEKFREAGIRTLLLKGASVAHWLYRDGQTRTYGDVDLLVSPAQFDLAEKILQEKGFRHLLAGAAPEEIRSTHVWLSSGEERVILELHRTFHNIEACDEDVWEEFSRSAERMTIAGCEVEMPAEPARCLVLALHASCHGKEFSWPLRDLTLAIERVSRDIWVEAVAMAGRLQALPAMAAGLRLVPLGELLAEQLALPTSVSTGIVIQSENMSRLTGNLNLMLATSGIRGKVVFAFRRMFPTPTWMRFRYGLDSCSRTRLVFAYLCRIGGLFRDLPSSLHALHRAQRRAIRADP